MIIHLGNIQINMCVFTIFFKNNNLKKKSWIMEIQSFIITHVMIMKFILFIISRVIIISLLPIFRAHAPPRWPATAAAGRPTLSAETRLCEVFTENFKTTTHGRAILSACPQIHSSVAISRKNHQGHHEYYSRKNSLIPLKLL